MPDSVPQAVLEPLSSSAIFLVVTIDEGAEQAVHGALPELSGLARAIGFRDPARRLSLVTAIGSEAWDRLFFRFAACPAMAVPGGARRTPRGAGHTR